MAEQGFCVHGWFIGLKSGLVETGEPDRGYGPG